MPHTDPSGAGARAVERVADPLVLRGIHRLSGLDVGVALAVAVRVEDRAASSPATSSRRRSRRTSSCSASRRPGCRTVGPDRVVGVLGEHQVVRLEARADVGELLRSSDRTRRDGARPCSTGTAFADGWLDPALQKSGFSGGRTVAVTQTRPCCPSSGCARSPARPDAPPRPSTATAAATAARRRVASSDREP